MSSPVPVRPEYVIAGVCADGCGFEGDAKEFEWVPTWAVNLRLRCPRCGKPSFEIPYQSLSTRGKLITLPNHYAPYSCENCETTSRFGPTFINGDRNNWCGTCSLAVVAYHALCLTRAPRKKPDFREFLNVLEEARERVAKRRVILPGS